MKTAKTESEKDAIPIAVEMHGPHVMVFDAHGVCSADVFRLHVVHTRQVPTISPSQDGLMAVHVVTC